MLLPDLSPLICRIDKGNMHGGTARTHKKSSSFAKQKAMECYDTRYEAQHSREFFHKIFLVRQECHAYCDKFSSRTGDLNL
jgi:hypothetical protein